MTRRSGTRIALLVLLAAIGCMAKRAGAPPTSAETPPPGAAAQIDALAEAEAELAANAAELNALGVKIAWGKDKKKSGEASDQATTRDVVEPEKNEPTQPPKPVTEPEHGRKRPTTKPTAPVSVKQDPTPTQVDPMASADDDGEPAAAASCKKICTLAGIACDLSKRICQLADEHQGDARYEDACWNAGQQCEDASDACTECSAC